MSRRELESGFPMVSTLHLLVVVSVLGASLLPLTDSIGGVGGEAVVSRAFTSDRQACARREAHLSTDDQRAALPAGNATSFVVGHDGKGIHCAGEPVTVTACLPDGSIDTDFADSVTLDTRVGRGTWSNGAENLGSFGDATADDGLASYRFDPADAGVATFVLSYPDGPSLLDVDVFQTSNAGIRDDDSEGTLEFSPSGFTLTASPLPDVPSSPVADAIPAQTAGTDFLLHLTAYGQTASDPECGVIESYVGAHLLRLWSSYIDPASGGSPVTIDGSAIATREAAAALQAVAFAAGRAAVAAQYRDVGIIQIHVKDDTVSDPPGGIAGATTPFVVRPADLAITRVTRVDGSPNPAASRHRLAAPGEGNDRTVDVEADLSPAALPWLRYDWPNDGNLDGICDDNPIGHATFGIFAGDDPVIYLGEVY